MKARLCVAVVLATTAAGALGIGAWRAWRASPEDRPVVDSRGDAPRADSGDRHEVSANNNAGESAAEHGLDARAEVAANALSGRCIDGTGAAVAGAELGWTALGDDDLGPEGVWGSLDWTAIDTRTKRATSSNDGAFAFDEPPADASDGPSVVWITHAEHEGIPFVVQASEIAQPLRRDFVLTARRGVTIQVIDSEKRAVDGALVETFGVRAPADCADPWIQRAYRLLHRAYATDSVGRTRVCVLAGEQAFLARKGELASPPRTETNPRVEVIELVLARCFTARGSVRLRSGEPDGRPVVVRPYADDGMQWTATEQTRVRSDLTWGPVTVPILPSAIGYEFRLVGGGLRTRFRDIPVPSAGETVVVDFETEPGLSLVVRVKSDHGEPLAGAHALADFWNDGEPDTVRRSTDAKGAALLEGLCGGEARIEVTAAGFVPGKAGPILLAAGEPTPEIEVVLERAGRVVGRCTHGGEPLTEFEVVWWQSDPAAARPEHFQGVEDGRFELDQVPLGELRILASAAPLPRCEPQLVQVTADAPAEVTLELPASIRARGRVVDLTTHEPIAEATVQLFTNAGAETLTWFGAPVKVDAGGRFETDLFGPGDNRFAVEAPGYAVAFCDAVGVPGQVLDLGTFVLARRQTLEVRLVASEALDFSGWMLDLRGQDWQTPRTPFEPTGRARVEGVAAGRFEVNAFSPGSPNEVFSVTAYLSPGRDWVVEIPLPGDATLEVEVVNPENAPERAGRTVECTVGGPGTQRVANAAPLTQEGVARFQHLPTGQVSVAVIGKGRRVLASRTLDLQRGENSVKIEVGDPGRSLRVVDRDGAPLAGAKVYFDARESRSWSFFQIADGAGVVQLPETAFEHLLGVIFHESLGVAIDVEVDLSRSRQDPLVVEVETGLDLVADLVDGDTPLPHVRADLFNASETSIVYQRQSDAQGRVVVDRVSRGRYHLKIDQAGLWPTAAEIDLRPESPPARVQVRRLGALEIEARDANGAEVAGASVSLRSVEFDADVASWVALGRVPAPPQGLATDASGRLRVDGLPRGEYRWSIGAASGACAVEPRGVVHVAAALP